MNPLIWAAIISLIVAAWQWNKIRVAGAVALALGIAIVAVQLFAVYVYFPDTYRCVRWQQTTNVDSYGNEVDGQACAWYIRRDGRRWTPWDTRMKHWFG